MQRHQRHGNDTDEDHLGDSEDTNTEHLAGEELVRAHRTENDLDDPIGLLFDDSDENPRTVRHNRHEQDHCYEERKDSVLVIVIFRRRGHRLDLVATGEQVGDLGDFYAEFCRPIGDFERGQGGDNRSRHLVARVVVHEHLAIRINGKLD